MASGFYELSASSDEALSTRQSSSFNEQSIESVDSFSSQSLSSSLSSGNQAEHRDASEKPESTGQISSFDGQSMESIDSSPSFSDTSSDNQGEEPATPHHAGDEVHPCDSEPLYEHADISVFVSYLLIFLFATKHSLSTRAVGELLQLLSVMLPKGANLPKTVYALKQFFVKLFPDLRSSIHYYCTCCHVIVPVGKVCRRPECVGYKTSEFISVPLQAQLKRKLEGELIMHI